MLRRLVKYADRVFGWSRSLDELRDARKRPRIATGRVMKALSVMMMARLGSLNSLEALRPKGWLRRWLGGEMPSADTLGRVAAQLAPEEVRRLLHRHYTRRRRNKGVYAWAFGLRPLIFDGHEAMASYHRHCPKCLSRTVHTAQGDRIQYYHRYVAALLATPSRVLFLDAEPQEPGEDEMACAKRLLERLLEVHPRAFTMVCGDNLYMNPDFCKLALRHRKHFIAVLKNENRDLLKDARDLFTGRRPQRAQRAKTQCLWWDLDGFTSWESIDTSVRVVRSVETHSIRRQLTRESEEVRSEWVWVTSLPSHLADTAAIVRLGHGRWDIENHGFNELANQWHADHVYRHDANALLVFWLLACLAYNLFHAFVSCNLKPALRSRHTTIYFAHMICSELHQFAFP
jgi:hypothetical protein